MSSFFREGAAPAPLATPTVAAGSYVRAPYVKPATSTASTDSIDSAVSTVADSDGSEDEN